MEHPLILNENKSLRARLLDLLKTSFHLPKKSNIVFVCGGNQKHHLRIRFRKYYEKRVREKKYRILFPEQAFPSLAKNDSSEPFNLADFERLIAEVSHAIVIFPEAPGSFAETGYFSAVDNISERTILALNGKFETIPSFLSLGPAQKFATKSTFQPMIHLNYLWPDFNKVVQKLDMRALSTHKKNLTIGKFSDLSAFHLFCLLHGIVDLLRVATLEDLEFFFNALFKARYSKQRVQQMLAILVGGNFLIQEGDYGHYKLGHSEAKFLEIRKGHQRKLNELRLEFATIYETEAREFRELLEEFKSC